VFCLKNLLNEFQRLNLTVNINSLDQTLLAELRSYQCVLRADKGIEL
jgi:hypothetical protein